MVLIITPLLTVPLLYTSMNNDLYNETIERRGRIYHYDPDTDTYYQRYASHSFWDNYAWIVVVVVLAICAFCIEYRPGLV
jgi:hypothetical protein